MNSAHARRCNRARETKEERVGDDVSDHLFGPGGLLRFSRIMPATENPSSADPPTQSVGGIQVDGLVALDQGLEPDPEESWDVRLNRFKEAAARHGNWASAGSGPGGPGAMSASRPPAAINALAASVLAQQSPTDGRVDSEAAQLPPRKPQAQSPLKSSLKKSAETQVPAMTTRGGWSASGGGQSLRVGAGNVSRLAAVFDQTHSKVLPPSLPPSLSLFLALALSLSPSLSRSLASARALSLPPLSPPSVFLSLSLSLSLSRCACLHHTHTCTHMQHTHNYMHTHATYT